MDCAGKVKLDSKKGKFYGFGSIITIYESVNCSKNVFTFLKLFLFNDIK